MSLECLQNLMASLSQLFIVDVLFIPTYFMYLLGHRVTLGRKHRARTRAVGREGGGREGGSTGNRKEEMRLFLRKGAASANYNEL